jgi:predicted DNA-binding protein
MAAKTQHKQGETHEQPTYVRLPTELHEAVKSRAKQDDRTMAQIIRVALRYYLTNTEPVV